MESSTGRKNPEWQMPYTDRTNSSQARPCSSIALPKFTMSKVEGDDSKHVKPNMSRDDSSHMRPLGGGGNPSWTKSKANKNNSEHETP